MLEKLKHKVYSLLRWSEKYTKTDMVYLAQGGFWLTLGQVVSFLASFLLTIAFANLLDKETYGVYKYILSVFGILAISNLAGVNVALTQAVARNYHGSILAALKTKMRWSIFGSLASLILAGYYYWQGNIILSISFIICAVFVIVIDNLTIYNAHLQGLKKFDTTTKYLIIVRIISTLFIAATIYFSSNIYLLLLAFFLPQTISRLFILIIVKNKYQANQEVDKETINYGKKLSFISIISTVGNQLDKILIFHYLGATELAIYSLASAPNEQIKGVLKNIENLALPKFAEKSKEEIKKTIFKKSLQLSLITLAIIICYIVLAPFVFKIFFPKYLESTIYSQALAISLVTLPIWVFQAALKAKKMTKQIYQIELINSISQIIITFILVVNFGLWGAVISRTIYRLINLTASAVLFKRS